MTFLLYRLGIPQARAALVSEVRLPPLVRSDYSQ
jgi:hypothetical protein